MKVSRLVPIYLFGCKRMSRKSVFIRNKLIIIMNKEKYWIINKYYNHNNKNNKSKFRKSI